MKITEAEQKLIDSVPVPFCAQVQNVLLDGKDYYMEAKAAAETLAGIPAYKDAVVASIGFASRAVAFAAMSGIEQFIDVGCGLPLPGHFGTAPGSAFASVLDTARQVCKDARIAYVDKERIVAAYARAWLAVDEKVTVVETDFTCTADVVQQAGELIDFSKPVCLLFSNVLHLMRPSAAHAAVSNWKEHLVPGSYLVISHPGNGAGGFQKKELAVAREIYKDAGFEFRASAASTLMDRYFKFLRMADPATEKPGIVSVHQWGMSYLDDPGRPLILGGVGVLT